MTAEKYTFPANYGEFDAVFREYRAIFEKQLRTVCDSFCDNGAKYKALYDAASYSLEAGGKRIRPVLAFEMCRVCGGDINDAVPAAVAVEMIHTFSLIHDDLPCMDDDDMRRGRPSCHKAHGEAVALLAGDALSAYAGKYICDSNLSAEKKTAMIKELYDRTLGMIEGQTIDTDGKFDTLDGLLSMYEMKTSELLTAASVMGCNAAEWAIDRLRFRRIRPSNFERNLCGRFTGRSRRHLNRQYDITIIISILRQFFCRCGRNKTLCFI